MITFNDNDLKSYLKQKTGYEVSSIYSVDNKYAIPEYVKYAIDTTTISVAAYCDVTKTPTLKGHTIKTFLWTETVNVSDFMKFIRSKKLCQINKSIN